MHHPVLQAIAQRQRHGSIPRGRQDDFKIAFAIEGGAMRGVVSSFMVAGLEYLGLLPAFDVIYGTSAGAINGAYFVAGQAAYGTSIYYEDINNPQFMSPLRCLCGDRPLSLEFLFEHVMINEKPLNWRRVLDSQIELVHVAASLSQAKAVLLRGARSRWSLFETEGQRANSVCSWPPPVCVDGEDCADGGLFASIPFRQALDEGCTHVLALLTRPNSTPLSRTSFLSRYVLSRMLARYNPLLRNIFVDRVNRYGRELDWLNTQTGTPSCVPYVCAVSLPRGTPNIRRFEKRPERLVFGARIGMTSILQAFGHRDTSCTEILYPHRQSPKGHRTLAWNERIARGRPSSFPSSATDAFDDVPLEPAQWSGRNERDSVAGGEVGDV
jgi:predicted patatin/cPLA2 family phospholipase